MQLELNWVDENEQSLLMTESGWAVAKVKKKELGWCPESCLCLSRYTIFSGTRKGGKKIIEETI